MKDQPSVPGNEIVNHPIETGMWQPIETAPSGQWLLTVRQDERRSMAVYWIDGLGNLFRLSDGAVERVAARPTHWMPLPDPPRKTDEPT